MSFNKKKDRGFIMSAAFIGLIILIAALAPLIAPNDPNVTNMMLAEAGPSAQYPFGNGVCYPEFCTEREHRCFLPCLLR